MTADEKTDPEEVDEAADVEQEEIAGILAVRNTVQSTAGQLIGHEFDGVSEISPTDDGWRAVVEVVERRAVPDTQDIIGRYEIELDTEATVHGYRRLDRYRRGDTTEFE
uniref:Gas vesicle protein n=2 Tax=Natrinema zhouii TaxID=1710539 RepID=A0A7D6CR09_9EURY